MTTARIAVFASGAGSNLQALLEHLAHLRAPAEPSGEPSTVAASVVLVASNRAAAGALAIGERAGAATAVLPNPADGGAMTQLLEQHRVDLIVLAGYLKRVPPTVTTAWRGRLVNVHPALLPAFGGPGLYGARVHAAVLAAGVRVSGATVHFVDELYDHGPIIAQWPVPVRPADTPSTLAERVLHVEHHLYPRAILAVATGRVRLDAAGRVFGEVWPTRPASAFVMSNEEEVG